MARLPSKGVAMGAVGRSAIFNLIFKVSDGCSAVAILRSVTRNILRQGSKYCGVHDRAVYFATQTIERNSRSISSRIPETGIAPTTKAIV